MQNAGLKLPALHLNLVQDDSRVGNCDCELAAAYEVDDFEIVVWLDFCFVPHCAGKNI